MNRIRTRAALVLVVASALITAGVAWANWSAALQTLEDPYPDCRFGLGVSIGNLEDFDTAQLGIGWYVDWNTHTQPARPHGVQHLQTIRLRQNKVNGVYLDSYVVTPTLDALGARVQANPGAIWIVGNEPDRVDVQDDMMPDMYARAYYDVFQVIKSNDSTARVAMPGLVEITPMRLRYLDEVRLAYQQKFTATLPVDVWTAHIYILPEGLSWGARYPVGVTPAEAPPMNYSIAQHDSQTIFQQQVRDMRSWMAQHGYRDTPLLFTEFGILYPADYVDELGRNFGAARVNTFMNGVFDFFRMATDPNTGYPADGNRLVQAWAWYSLADTALNGFLFDPATKQVTALGQNYAAYTRNLGPDPFVPQTWGLAYSQGEPVTATLTARVSNRGNTAYSGTYSVTFYSDLSRTQVIGAVALAGLASQATQVVQSEWPSLTPGTYPVYVALEAAGAESNKCNNWSQGTVLVARQQVYLPMVRRN